MPDPLDSFRDIRTGERAVLVDGQLDMVHAQGERHVFIGRLVDKISRTGDERTANTGATNAFIRALEEEYGPKIGPWVARDLHEHARDAKPLTGRRIKEVIAEAEKLLARERAELDRMLGPTVQRIVTEEINRLKEDGLDIPDELHEHLVAEARRAVSASPKFIDPTRLTGGTFTEEFGPLICGTVQREALLMVPALQLAQEQGFDLPPELIKTYGDVVRGKMMEHVHPLPTLNDWRGAIDEHMALVSHEALEQLFPPRYLELGFTKAQVMRFVAEEGELEYAVALRRAKVSVEAILDYQQAGVDLETARMLHRHGIAGENVGRELRDRQERAQTVKWLAQAREAGFDTMDVLWLVQHGADPEDIERFTPEELHLLQDHGLSLAAGRDYKAKNIPIQFDTMPRQRIVEVGGELHGGLLSKPVRVTTVDDRGRVRESVFKEEVPGVGYGPSSVALGIDKDNPRMGFRNIAFKRVDELINFRLAPRTEYCVCGDKVGILMDFAPGSTPSRTVRTEILGTRRDRAMGELFKIRMELDPFRRDLFMKEWSQAYQLEETWENGQKVERIYFMKSVAVDFDYSDPDLRREMVKMQLLDALVGQGDRNCGNYVILLDDDGKFQRLVAIDNDQCFGKSITDPNHLLGTSKKVEGVRYGDVRFNGVLLPQVVDQDMFDLIDQLQPDQLVGVLQGYVTEQEIDSAVKRLDVLKGHMLKLQKDGKVINPKDWGGTVAELALQDKHFSYVGRDSQLITVMDRISYQDSMEM